MNWPFEGLERGAYRALMVDPPWKFKSRTKLDAANWSSRRDAEKHYPVMTFADLLAFPVGELAAKDAHLFLWTTGPFLRMAFDLIDSWGFRYSAIAFTWVKLKRSHKPTELRLAESDLHVGLGHTTRKNTEICLLGRRGNAKRIAKDVREVILSPVREHSRKPDEAAPRIARYCDGPYAELFARSARAGWDCWGNEVGKFEPA